VLPDSHTLIVQPDPALARVLAARFAGHGHRISLIGADRDQLSGLSRQLGDAGIEAMHAASLLTEPASLCEALGKVQAAWGTPSVVVHLGAAHLAGRVRSLDAHGLGQAVGDSASGMVSLLQGVLPPMAARGSGVILVAGHGSALDPLPHQAGDGAIGAAVRAITLAAARDYERDGVHIAMLTINGEPADDGPFERGRIAETLWDMAQEPSGLWSHERLYSGQRS
jgi:NADP-dependent 3-hydroxy acid dehydrogenase YdfG